MRAAFYCFLYGSPLLIAKDTIPCRGCFQGVLNNEMYTRKSAENTLTMGWVGGILKKLSRLTASHFKNFKKVEKSA